MAVFKYKVLDKEMKPFTGLIEATNENSAAGILQDRGLVIVSLKQKSTFIRLDGFPIIGRVKIKDIVIFARQFSVLISANIAIVESLRIIVKQTVNNKLRAIVIEIADEVDGGLKLSDALAKRPKVFSSFFVNVVKSGETSGKLDEVLTYLADEMEKDYDMMAKFKGAMIYPAFVLSGLVLVGIIMMVSVLPKLTAILTESGAELPLATKILMGTSGFLKSYWWALILIVVGLIVGLKLFTKNPYGRIIIDSAILKLPIFGKLFRFVYLVRFTRSLNTLIVGGVAITKGLKITADVVSNQVFKDVITKTIKEVEDGNSIATVFVTSKEIPTMVSQMMSIGEKTGKLDLVLSKITDFYGREVDNMLANLMTLMEPIIMVIMGVAVGIMVAAIILPMYNMATSF